MGGYLLPYRYKSLIKHLIILVIVIIIITIQVVVTVVPYTSIEQKHNIQTPDTRLSLIYSIYIYIFGHYHSFSIFLPCNDSVAVLNPSEGEHILLYRRRATPTTTMTGEPACLSVRLPVRLSVQGYMIESR